MEEILIIGNKKYEKLNINKILDSYKNNYRFNFSIPNKNNGTKYNKLVLNNHVFKFVKTNIKTYKNIYCKELNISEKYIEEFFSILKNYNIIEKQSNNWKIFNDFLKSVNCPYYFSHLPRVGHIKIMELIMERKKPIIFGFSLNNFYNDKHLYNNNLMYGDAKKNNIERTGHNHEIEEKILKWLHENKYIDATLCLLKDDENIIIEENILTPSKEIIEKLRLAI